MNYVRERCSIDLVWSRGIACRRATGPRSINRIVRVVQCAGDASVAESDNMLFGPYDISNIITIINGYPERRGCHEVDEGVLANRSS